VVLNLVKIICSEHAENVYVSMRSIVDFTVLGDLVSLVHSGSQFKILSELMTHGRLNVTVLYVCRAGQTFGFHAECAAAASPHLDAGNCSS
jgi:hypothetical protein